ncbi:MAG: TraB/GumN family protein [Haliea sp.]|nr:MAG: TraB/GumN family protein [Haliea sp.]
MMHWLHRALLALLTLGCAAAACAQADCPPTPRPFSPELFRQAAPHARDRGLLWAISKDGRTSYLYGTLHVGRAQWMSPGPGLKQALQASQVLALELDPLDETIQRELAKGFASVKRTLTPATLRRLQAAWAAACLPADTLARGAPELQVFDLMIADAMREGLSPLYGSEILLSMMARGLGRSVVSLETVAQQLEALMARDDAEAEGYVVDTLDDLERGKGRAVVLRTAEVWERGDLAQMERYAQWCECIDSESERKLMKRLLEDRNPGLADSVDRLHAQGKTVLAAVGALHLPGAGGLAALLAIKGYAVRRVH